MYKLIDLLYGTLIISSFFIIGGIAKETRLLSKGTINFGLIISAVYMIYLYIVQSNIYRYIIYFVVVILIYVLQKLMKKKNYKNICNIMILMLFSIIATNEIIFIVSVIFTFIIHLISYLFTKQKNTNYIFYFSFLNILFMIIYNIV